MNITQRDDAIYAMRGEGKTFAEIGKHFGISAGRARDIYNGRKFMAEKFPPSDFPRSLSTRALNSLNFAGIKNMRQLANFDPAEFAKSGNVGKKTWLEVAEVAGWKIDNAIPVTGNEAALPNKVEQKAIDGLRAKGWTIEPPRHPGGSTADNAEREHNDDG